MTDLLLPFAFQFVAEVLHLIQLYWFEFVVPKTVTTLANWCDLVDHSCTHYNACMTTV